MRLSKATGAKTCRQCPKIDYSAQFMLVLYMYIWLLFTISLGVQSCFQTREVFTSIAVYVAMQ